METHEVVDILQIKKIRHKMLCDQLHDTYCRKNSDYGDSFGISFSELGPISALTRMFDKFNRLKALMGHNQNEQQVNDESIADTLMDLANYCIMTCIEMERESAEGISIKPERNSGEWDYGLTPTMVHHTAVPQQSPQLSDNSITGHKPDELGKTICDNRTPVQSGRKYVRNKDKSRSMERSM